MTQAADPLETTPATANCDHPDFHVEAGIHRLTDDGGRVRNYVVELKVRCTACGVAFQFLGAPTGFAFKRPTVDVPATTLHAPIAPGERTIDQVPARITYEMPPKES